MLKRRLLLAVAVVAVLAGATAAVVMAAQPGKHARRAAHARTGPLAAAASYLGVSPARLRRELSSGETLAQIAATTAGKSEAGLAQALERAQRKRLAARSASIPARVSREIHAVHGVDVLAVSARYLGVSRAHLRQQLRAGSTLAHIADATAGKSQAGLVQALVAARREALDARVSAGRLSRKAAEAKLARIRKRVAARVNGKRPHSRAARS
ncbi:MAG TPA: hypothetical protein VKV16_01510 [Solirubrobacteraceae bacterium]|nr:hypothetical protein [Solirubrobacteraceae bacterium]